MSPKAKIQHKTNSETIRGSYARVVSTCGGIDQIDRQAASNHWHQAVPDATKLHKVGLLPNAGTSAQCETPRLTDRKYSI